MNNGFNYGWEFFKGILRIFWKFLKNIWIFYVKIKGFICNSILNGRVYGLVMVEVVFFMKFINCLFYKIVEVFSGI